VSKVTTPKIKATKPKTAKQIIGTIGENAVCEYLKNKGFTVLDRNYWKKWGELDIVAKKDNRIHFIEVKSVSGHISAQISRERGFGNDYRAEDNMHPWKVKRLSRVLQTYLLDKRISDKVAWQFDLATVIVDQERRVCRVSILEDIVL